MSTYPIAAQNAIIHTSVGIAAGTFIERILPAYNDDEHVNETVQDTLLQAALNGVLIVFLNSTLLSNDVNLGGGLFFTSLFAAQPALHRRIATLSSAMVATAVATEA